MIVTGRGQQQQAMVPQLLTDVFICKLMRQAYFLRLMLDRSTVDDGDLELLDNGLVDSITLVLVSHLC